MAYSAKIISEIKATNPQYNECDVNCIVSMKGGGNISITYYIGCHGNGC